SSGKPSTSTVGSPRRTWAVPAGEAGLGARQGEPQPPGREPDEHDRHGGKDAELREHVSDRTAVAAQLRQRVDSPGMRSDVRDGGHGGPVQLERKHGAAERAEHQPGKYG